MKLTSIFSGLVATLAASAVATPLTNLHKRDAAKLGEIVNDISSQVDELTTTVKGYDGNIFTALKIQIKTSKVGGGLEDGIEETKASQPFTDEESASVAQTLVGLQPKLTTLADALIEKKDIFKKGILGIIPLTGLVKSGLEKQQKLSAEFGEEVIKKLNKQFADLAPIVNDKIAADLARAIEAFS
ncbi:hypothetical protein FQN50_001702 [Emmonsiellopsis sp. PD_5]|nr:hypothetical protein FQN50_001702 [Emmonsiellopsis sp. PD_5]